jgi:hypothetical protein
MSLPWTFGPQSSVTLPMLNDNFVALGALTPIPCAITGTTTLTLTPLTNTPTISAYANYMQFTGIAPATNAGAVNALVAGLGTVAVYKDGPAGPTALTGGEIRDDTLITLIYDTALNSGAGGFHLQSTQAGLGSYLPLSGGTLTGVLIGTSAAFVGQLSAVLATITRGEFATSVTSPIGRFASVTSVAQIQFAAGATSITSLLLGFATISGVSIPANDTADQGMFVSGAAVGDMVMIAPSSLGAGYGVQAFVTSTNTVTVRFSNPTAGPLVSATPATYRVSVWRI